jgi:hypothetical protein
MSPASALRWGRLLPRVGGRPQAQQMNPDLSCGSESPVPNLAWVVANDAELAGTGDSLEHWLADEFKRINALAEQQEADNDALIDREIAQLLSESVRFASGHLRDSVHSLAAAEQSDRDSISADVRRLWGEPLRTFRATLRLCRAHVDRFNAAYRSTAAARDDAQFEAIVSLHARGCLIASEVYALTATGHGLGAVALWRSLHELAVYSRVLLNGHQELARRYLSSALIDEYNAAKQFNKHCDELGLEPVADEEMQTLADAAKCAVQAFGVGFDTPNGWARPLFPNARPRERITIARLEGLAGLSRMRPHYALASVRIHPEARGSTLATSDGPNGRREFDVVPAAVGLADGASGALLALLQVTSCVFELAKRRADESRPDLAAAWMVRQRALEARLEDAKTTLAAAHHRIEALRSARART